MGFLDRKNKNTKEINIDIIKNEKLPILTLDKNWHNMFPPGHKTEKMIELEAEVNNLLKEQGNLTNKQKEYGNLKKEFLNKIIALTTDAYDNDSQSAKKDINQSGKYIEEINSELKGIEERLYEIPRQIKSVNSELFKESVKLCYEQMKDNKVRIKQLNMEISDLRQRLKDRIDEKQTKEEQVERVYIFLHNLVGADIINKIDKYLE